MGTRKMTAVVVAAMALHYGLSQFLAAATTFAEEQEERDLAPRQRTAA